ncbi:MAG: PEP-CTERM sorting domain-containing protein [Leptolyngbyaceae cyanobacterium bins.349]|nr:PEP-CTERM sorting domain-containing protein [Leptolyngbyaceae cyanobacterium bins.349]
MSTLQFPPIVSATVTASAIAVFSLGVAAPATATSTPAPLFDSTASYTTTIPRSDGRVDSAQIYYPVVPGGTVPGNLPIALLLQGALVDQADYANFANLVARYGFTVVVPNHVRTLVDPVAGPVPGLFPEQQQVNDVLAFLKLENTNPAAPIAGVVDTSKLGLLGHSFGGAVGLAAVQDACIPILCVGGYTRPPELKAGAFYGSSFFDPRFQNTIPPIQNQVPVALIAGSLDGVAPLPLVTATYNQVQNLPKALITVNGANHYGITNVDNVQRDRIRPTLEQAVATETIARWSALFLRANILDDPAAFNYVFSTGDALDPNVTTTAAVPEPASILGMLTFAGGALVLKRQRQTEK